MQKRYITISIISIALILTFIIIAYSNNKFKTFNEDGITYALMVDGNSATSFPSKGMYQVDTECDGATGTWDYDNWKLKLKNITGNISCDISFNSISKEYLNQKIIGLSGTEQGNGQVVHEIANIPDYSNVTTLNQDQYLSVSTYSATSYYATSGTAISNIFTYNGTEWSSNPSNMTSNTYYHFKFNVPEDGYYQMCYQMSAGNSSNRLYIYNDNNKKLDINVYEYYTNKGCVNIGEASTLNPIRVVQSAYTSISTVNFSIKKVNSVDIKDAGYRYEGKNPNNYIWFNNELWRIIGTFNNESHGQSGHNLVKIIKDSSLGGLAWDKSSVSNWETSSLKALLNGAYYNRQDGTDSGYCYGYSTSVPTNCDYTDNGINDVYRGMIKNVAWFLGGWDTNLVTSEEMYGYERGTKVYTGRPTSTTGYIGLMYASDYGYSVLDSSCTRTTNLYSYDRAVCGGQSWLYKVGTEYTINSDSRFDNGVFYLAENKSLRNVSIAQYGYAVRPTLYLDSSVYVLDGDGSLLDPYIIGM